MKRVLCLKRQIRFDFERTWWNHGRFRGSISKRTRGSVIPAASSLSESDVEDKDDDVYYDEEVDEDELRLRASEQLSLKGRDISGSTTSAAATKTMEELYQRKTPVEHVLLRPDSYVGSVSQSYITLPVLSKSSHQIEERKILYVPALYKIFDEILVNAADNKQRDAGTSRIDVTIDERSGRVTIRNNGAGVPVAVHKKEGMYVPDLVFGQLLTGSNFDDSVRKVTGGRNGFGAKLTNIFSVEFTVETVDTRRRLKFRKTWRDNMSRSDEAEVRALSEAELSKGDYTEVSFVPDFARFRMSGWHDTDVLELLHRRVQDVASCNEGVEVRLNNRLMTGSWEPYTHIFTPGRYVSLSPNKRWYVIIGVSSTGQFQQTSFVNSIATHRGGTHVTHVAEQVVRYCYERLRIKHPRLNVQPPQIRNHLAVLVSCLVENPTFDSQTKDTLTARSSDFGSRCRLSKATLQTLVDEIGLLDEIVTWAELRQKAELNRRTGPKSGTRITGIPKLDDANEAGGSRSQECTLILTEGDSAKALAVSGLSVVGRDLYGVYPLKGKILNVRDASHSQLLENKELAELERILGLSHESTAPSSPAGGAATETLPLAESPPLSAEQLRQGMRYGKVLLMTDQDHDGSHIKGLFVNFIHKFWPSLLRDRFLQQFVTPLIKATAPRSSEVKSFFSSAEYEQWRREIEEREGPGALARWRIKYYKGLGTNTSDEAKQYFHAMDRHRHEFEWGQSAATAASTADSVDDGARPDETDDLVDKMFAKSRAHDRKEWISSVYDPGVYLEACGRGGGRAGNPRSVDFRDFFNKEFVHYANAANVRAIPSVIDGLKPGQRKILYSCFKRKLVDEIKVAQLGGYVSEQTNYHHGEQSLYGTIVHMAQDFVGSNNVNLLVPSGQFGTRLQGGFDAASPRYIFTRLAPITRHIYREEDDPLCRLREEDGEFVEPEHYVPVVPMVLINGVDGLGTGWSTSIPAFNPLDVLANLRRRLRGADLQELAPWYRGFRGTVVRSTPTTYRSTGSWSLDGDDSRVLRITELPVGTWTYSYKEMLEEYIRPPHNARPRIKGYKEFHTERDVHFAVELTRAQLEAAQQDGIERRFKLTGSISLSNMHLFGSDGRIRAYKSPLEILEEFADVRLDYYGRRREHWLGQLSRQLRTLSNQLRFCQLVASGELRLSNVPMTQLVADLSRLGFDRSDEAPDEAEGSHSAAGFGYLLKTPVSSLTLERIQQLLQREEAKRAEHAELEARSPTSLWEQDLDELEPLLISAVEPPRGPRRSRKSSSKTSKNSK